ncbi:MAG: hypothetical protein HXY39_00560 [Chloroflexi bacterium]|nr:hypothetical protein [Chloroflexota bacterium]
MHTYYRGILATERRVDRRNQAGGRRIKQGDETYQCLTISTFSLQSTTG